MSALWAADPGEAMNARAAGIVCAALLSLLLARDARAQGFPDVELSVVSTIVAANTTAIVISNQASSVYGVDAFSNNTTLAYIKLYDAASGVTCGQSSPAPKYRALIPFGASSAGGGFTLSNPNGDGYAFGITLCVTGGIADSDTGAPAASSYIVNVHYHKR